MLRRCFPEMVGQDALHVAAKMRSRVVVAIARGEREQAVAIHDLERDIQAIDDPLDLQSVPPIGYLIVGDEHRYYSFREAGVLGATPTTR